VGQIAASSLLDSSQARRCGDAPSAVTYYRPAVTFEEMEVTLRARLQALPHQRWDGPNPRALT